MPYKRIEELPKTVRDSLPEEAQRIFMGAVNGAVERPGMKEGQAMAIGWTAVKRKFHEINGKWVAKSDYGDFIMNEAKKILPESWYAKIQAAARAYAGGKAYKPNREHNTLMKLSPETLKAMKDAQVEKLHARAHALHKCTPTTSDVHSQGYVKLKNLKKFHGWVAKEMARRNMPHAMADAMDEEAGMHKSIEMAFVSKADEKQVAYGVVYEPNEVDTQDDWARAEEIEKAAHHFMERYRQMDINHDGDVRDDLVPVESYLAPVDFTLSETAVKKGSWVMGVHARNPETWQAIKSGELSGLSMFGLAHRKDGTPQGRAEASGESPAQ